jgi:hypothetical protein
LAAQGLQPRFLAAQGLQPRFAAQGLQPRFLAAQGLQAASWTLLDLLMSAAAAGRAVDAAAIAATLRIVAVFLIFIWISRPKRIFGTERKFHPEAECGDQDTIVSTIRNSPLPLHNHAGPRHQLITRSPAFNLL